MTGKLLVLVSVLVLAVPFGLAQEEPPAGAETPVLPDIEVEVSTLDSMTVASIARTGPYDGVGVVIGELLAWTGKNEVQIVGAPFGVYYDNPEEVPPESTKYEVAVPVSEGTESDPDAGVEVKPWGGMTVAKTLHVGPYDAVGLVYGALMAWVQESDYSIAGPAIEVYFNSPEQVPSESLRTEVGFVVLPKTE